MLLYVSTNQRSAPVVAGGIRWHPCLSLMLTINPQWLAEENNCRGPKKQQQTNQKLNSLKLETEAAQSKADEYSDRVKQLEQDVMQRDQEIASLTHKNTLLETEVEELETHLKDAKGAAEEGAATGSQNESLVKKISLLEDELEASDRNLRETTEKLRQTDVKAEHLERRVTSVEAERDEWEKKFEDLSEKYASAKAELEEITLQLENI